MSRFTSLGLAVTAIAVTACSAPSPTPSLNLEDASRAHFQAGLDLAISMDLSDAQIAAFRRAATSGTMTYEDVATLAEDTYTCLEDQGFEVTRVDPVEFAPGMLTPRYEGGASTVNMDLDTIDSLVTYCDNHYSHIALLYYETQPLAIQLQDQALEEARPEVLACLREHDMVIDDDASFDEIRVANAIMFDQLSSDAGPGPSCLP